MALHDATRITEMLHLLSDQSVPPCILLEPIRSTTLQLTARVALSKLDPRPTVLCQVHLAQPSKQYLTFPRATFVEVNTIRGWYHIFLQSIKFLMERSLDVAHLRHLRAIFGMREIPVSYLSVGAAGYGTLQRTSIRARSSECCKGIYPEGGGSHDERCWFFDVVGSTNADDLAGSAICVSWRC